MNRPRGLNRRLIKQEWISAIFSKEMLGVLAVEAIIAFILIYSLWASQKQILSGELKTLTALSAAMAAQADSTLDLADAVLRTTQRELAEGLLNLSDSNTNRFLRNKTATLNKFRALVVLDSNGYRTATSRDITAAPSSLAERDFFKAAEQDTSNDIFVSSPYTSINDGKPSVSVSLSWRNNLGKFLGVILLVAEPEFLDGEFNRIAPSTDTRMAIFRRDNALVSDGPGDTNNQLVPLASLAALWAGSEKQSSGQVKFADGRDHLIAASKLRRFPLLVVITRDTAAVLGNWTILARIIGSFALFAFIVTLFITASRKRDQLHARAADEGLRVEQQRAARATLAAREGNWEWHPHTRTSYMSPRMHELMGSSEGSAVDKDYLSSGASFFEAKSVHPDDASNIAIALNSEPSRESQPFDITIRVRHRADQWRHVRLRGQATTDNQSMIYSGTASDVTEEVQAQQQTQILETQLAQAKKFEALGTLAGGVAHDFNNILSAVIGFGELARSGASNGSNQARHIDQVLQAGERGKALVERIMSFSQVGTRPHRTMLLNAIIREVADTVSATLPSNITLVNEIDSKRIGISGDSIMVFEAALNLCTNAIQSMANGGTLTITLKKQTISEHLTLRYQSLVAGEYACLAISDTGAGIDAATLPHLFEPFFTTKSAQKGTGLGLAVVHGVMNDLAGAIDLQTAVNNGTTFTLYFPAVPIDDSINEPVITGANLSLSLGNGQSILIVDDDPAIVQLMEESLAQMGYEPIGFSSSTEALAAFKADPTRFDLVITDEDMPELKGTVLASIISKLRPELPIILASGFGGQQLADRAQSAGITVVLRKPLSNYAVSQTISRLLEFTSNP